MIWTDSREQVNWEALLSGRGIPVTTQMLEFGDFSFPGLDPFDATREIAIGIERKEIGDLLNSLRSNRVQTQILGMRDTYDRSFLLIEGPYRPDSEGMLEWLKSGRGGESRWKRPDFGNFYYSEPFNFSVELQLLGIPVIRSWGAEETVRQILALYTWFQKSEHKAFDFLPQQQEVGRGPIGMIDHFKGDRARQVVFETAGRLSSIGPKKAFLVAKRFGSVREMCEAEVTEWMKLKGIGKLMATQAKEELNGNKNR